MLHDVLLALFGFPGNVLTQSDNGEFALAPGVSFLSKSQATVLSRLCDVATHHSQLAAVVDKFSVPLQVQLGAHPHGHAARAGHAQSIYHCALASGAQETLARYRAAVVQLEQQAIHEPTTSLLDVLHALADFELQLPALNLLITGLTSRGVRGGQLLSEVFTAAHKCGSPAVRACLDSLLQACNAVLFARVGAWMLHGQLEDPFNEFFIARVPHEQPPSQPAPHAIATPAHPAPSDMFWTSFCVRKEMLPCYLPDHVVQKILFVGKAVQVVQLYDAAHAEHGERVTSSAMPISEIQALQLKLAELESRPQFQLLAVECVVESIRAAAARHLWHLVVHKAHLVQHLEAMREVFLLGQGTMFQFFIEDTAQLMSLPPSRSASNDLKSFFTIAAGKDAYDDEIVGRFELRLQRDEEIDGEKHASKLVSNRKEADKWNRLHLDYDAPWPVSIILHRGVLAKYNALFRFLYTVKRARVGVQNAWLPLVAHRRSDATTHALVRRLMLVGHRMGFFLNALDYFLQVDVIDTHFAELKGFATASEDFEAVLRRHDEFVDTLSTIVLSSRDVVFRTLEDLFARCQQFTLLVNNGIEGVNVAAIDNLSTEFDRLMQLLFTVLSGIQERQSSAHLGKLLLRLDFNNHLHHSLARPGRSPA